MRNHSLACAVAVASMGLASCGHMPGERPLVQAPTVCEDFSISIYFDPGSSRLTREAQALLRMASKRTRTCAVSGVQVLGLADAPGDPDANLTLSRQRAATVTKALARGGIAPETIDVAAAGDAGAETRSGAARPLRRRADVLFHASPRTP